MYHIYYLAYKDYGGIGLRVLDFLKSLFEDMTLKIKEIKVILKIMYSRNVKHRYFYFDRCCV